MNVSELITALEKVKDKNKEVVLDFTKPGSEFFKLLGVHTVEEINADGDSELVMLTGWDYSEEEPNLN